MSLAEQYHANHKARQTRLGDVAQPSRITAVAPAAFLREKRIYKPRGTIRAEDHYPCMWFWDLIVLSPKRDLTSRPTIKKIIKVVAYRYDVTADDILSMRRGRAVAWPRQIVMYLARHMTLRSLPEIGRVLNNRDHTTILHGVRKVTAAVAASNELKVAIEELKQEIAFP